MAKHALFIQHKTLPGKRDEVQRVWRKHMMPAIRANEGHEAYFYCFGSDPDTICAFQQYTDSDSMQARSSRRLHTPLISMKFRLYCLVNPT